jgi:hypothetical protein
MNSTRLSMIPWTACALVLIFLAAWPVWSGMIVLNDDVKFLRSPSCDGALPDELRSAWLNAPSFRPMEIAMGRLCNAETLACPWVMPVQMAGFITLAIALTRLAAMVMPGEPLLAPLALLITALSPATTCSIWQMDACSQTWSAALGLWACVHAWNGCDTSAHRWPVRSTCWLLATFMPLLLVKETAFGWSFGIGSCILLIAVSRFMRDRPAAMRTLLLTVPVILLPLAFLATRIALGAVGRSLEGDDGSRYQVEIGLNSLINLLVSAGAAFTTGPYYLLGDQQAPMALRALPAIAAALLIIPLAASIEFLVLRGRAEDRRTMARATVLTLAASGSIVVTCVLQSVSELYGLGLNAAAAVLVVSAVLRLGSRVTARLAANLIRACVAIAMAIGLVGLAGRAHHFAVTWQATADANRVMLDSIAATDLQKPGCAITLCFDASCRPASTYAQYLIPLQQSMDMIHTIPWVERRWKGLRLLIRMDRPCDPAMPGAVPMPCGPLARHGHW